AQAPVAGRETGRGGDARARRRRHRGLPGGRLMPVMLTDGAARDLDEWYAAAYARGGAGEAGRILDRIQVVLAAVDEGSLRDEPLPELRQLGRHGERQVVTPEGLRVVFRREDGRVLVVLMSPVTRSFQSLLVRRMLDA